MQPGYGLVTGFMMLVSLFMWFQIIFGVAGAASSKGHNGFVWAIYALVLPLAAAIHVFNIPPEIAPPVAQRVPPQM